MSDDLVIEIYLPEVKPVSTNSAYIPITTKKVDKRGRNIAVKTASEGLKKYHKQMNEILKYYDKNVIKQINTLMRDINYELHVSYDVFIPKRYYPRSDASNYLKATEDGVANFFEKDDRYNKSAYIEKFEAEGKDWSVLLRFIFKRVL